MKKVTVAAMAAMVLVTSAIAADEQGALLANTNGVFTVGAGFANTESAGSPALMLNYVQIDDIALLNADLETSKNYLGFSLKSNVLPAINSSYAGVGYISADGQDKTIASDGYAPASTKHVTEQGVFGVVGFQDNFNVDGVKVSGDIGYRIGDINGPTASIALSKKFGPDFYSQTLGLKVGFEQLKNADENINRMAVYGTLTF